MLTAVLVVERKSGSCWGLSKVWRMRNKIDNQPVSLTVTNQLLGKDKSRSESLLSKDSFLEDGGSGGKEGLDTTYCHCHGESGSTSS